MIQKIKNYLFLAITTIMLAVPVLVPATVAYAATTPAAGCDSGVTSGIAQGVNGAIAATDPNKGVDCQTTGADGSTITKVAKTAVNLFSIIVGAVAVIMIIYGGFRYITSGGDSGNVGNAKNTLIYAIVGLIIVALAQIIVQFVLSQSSQVSPGAE